MSREIKSREMPCENVTHNTRKHEKKIQNKKRDRKLGNVEIRERE